MTEGFIRPHKSMYDFADSKALETMRLNDQLEWFFKCWGPEIPEHDRYRFEADVGMLMRACYQDASFNSNRMLASISQVADLVLAANPLLRNKIILPEKR